MDQRPAATDRRPDLTVIVVTHNGCEMALTTLRSAHENLGDASAEWLVVDSGSTDGTPDAIEREFPRVRVFRATNRGFAAGNNIGLEHARGRYVLLLNPDVEIARGTFAELIAALDERPEVGVASVLTKGSHGDLLPTIRRLPTPARDFGEALWAARLPALSRWQELDVEFSRYDEERSADWLVGAFLLARAEAVEQVGPMDDGFFLYSEEIDWCHRFGLAGWDVRHLPLMTIVHHGGDSERPDLVAQLSSSRRRFAYKHFGRPTAFGIHLALMLKHVLRLVALAPGAVIRPASRSRARAEANGLAVLAGLANPPYGGS